MSSLVSLIIALFSILITVLLLVVASLAIVVLLIVFMFASIIIGVQQESVFKGLRVFTIACAVAIIAPVSALLFKFNLAETLGISMNQALWLGGALGVIVSIVFVLISFKVFLKISTLSYEYINKKVKKSPN